MPFVFLLLLTFLSACTSTPPAGPGPAATFPDTDTRVRLFDRFVAEMERIDGEGLPARANRPESWKATIARLRLEAEKAQTPVDYGQVFHRLDMTYTNLHAQVTLRNDYEIAPDRQRPAIAVRFRAETISKGRKSYRYRITNAGKSMLQDLNAADRPVPGDELLRINGRDIQYWARENFIFCKFPYREQCEVNFFDSFRKGYLGWDWRQPLTYTLRRGARVWTVTIPVGSPPARKTASEDVPVQTARPERQCPESYNSYKDFVPVYKGVNICVYESPKYPGVTLLHLASFRYDPPEGETIVSVGAEVNAFNDAYWRAKAGTVRKLIIDVQENGGGNIPVSWYQIFLTQPFQEQYVQFKKTPEFEVPEIRANLFYADPAKDIWLAKLKSSGTYGKLKMGAFLPPIPQFCATDDQSCEIGRYEPLKHGFKGQIRILVNEWCISSCTGFVWNMKDKLGSRVKLVGMPDSGDSGYARLFVDAYLDAAAPEGARVTVSGRTPLSRQRLPEGALVRQQVSATRSTDERGRIVSAIPARVQLWVPRSYSDTDDAWMAKSLETALRN